MCMQILRHRFLYYVLAKPIISDFEYDALESKLREFESAHPDLVHPKTPTKFVGSNLPWDYPLGIQHLYKDDLERLGYSFDQTNRKEPK